MLQRLLLRLGAALGVALWVLAAVLPAGAGPLHDALDREAQAIEPLMIAWRRDIHQNPELGNRSNIIPDSVELEGTLRTQDMETRNFIVKRVTETTQGIAKGGGGEAIVL